MTSKASSLLCDVIESSQVTVKRRHQEVRCTDTAEREASTSRGASMPPGQRPARNVNTPELSNTDRDREPHGHAQAVTNNLRLGGIT